MSVVVLLHHVQGLTEGIIALAHELVDAGHVVHVPDLFDGRTFESIEDGFDYTKSLPDGTIDQRARSAVEELPTDVVYVGVSFGVPRALELTVERPGAKALVMLESAMPLAGEWAVGPFPDDVRLQIHGGEADEFFAEDREFADEAVALLGSRAELFTYPGCRHLFTDSSLAAHDAEARALVIQRVLALLSLLDSEA